MHNTLTTILNEGWGVREKVMTNEVGKPSKQNSFLPQAEFFWLDNSAEETLQKISLIGGSGVLNKFMTSLNSTQLALQFFLSRFPRSVLVCSASILLDRQKPDS